MLDAVRIQTTEMPAVETGTAITQTEKEAFLSLKTADDSSFFRDAYVFVPVVR